MPRQRSRTSTIPTDVPTGPASAFHTVSRTAIQDFRDLPGLHRHLFRIFPRYAKGIYQAPSRTWEENHRHQLALCPGTSWPFVQCLQWPSPTPTTLHLGNSQTGLPGPSSGCSRIPATPIIMAGHPRTSRTYFQRPMQTFQDLLFPGAMCQWPHLSHHSWCEDHVCKCMPNSQLWAHPTTLHPVTLCIAWPGVFAAQLFRLVLPCKITLLPPVAMLDMLVRGR